MNYAIAHNLPSHIKFIREGKNIFQRQDDGSFDLFIQAKTISSAKRTVRNELNCKGGPRSNVRTATSLDCE